MGAGASSVPASVEEARMAGFSEEAIEKYLSEPTNIVTTESTLPNDAVVETPEEDDAEAREEPQAELPEFVVVAPGVKVSKDGTVTPSADSKLGMLYVAVLQHLIRPTKSSSANNCNNGDKGRCVAKWTWRRTPGLRWHLFLSEAQGQSVPWKKLGSICWDWASMPGGVAPLVNFTQGFRVLCRKAMLVETLRHHLAARPESGVDQWFPPSFVFYPAKPEKSERAAFLAAFEARVGQGRNAWILKPSDGGKGEGIKVMAGDVTPSTISPAPLDDSPAVQYTAEVQAAAVPNEREGTEAAQEETAMAVPAGAQPILDFLDGRPAGSIAWVVSEYLENPLLLPGGLKFDWRLWVLLSCEAKGHYTIRLYREGVLRTCSVAYNVEDLENEFAHLSNHCIQVKSATYGDAAGGAGGTNEMFYDEFRAVLGSGVLEEKLLPQAKRVIVETLLAAQSTLEVDPELSGAGSFNVYGFDLMVDDALNVKLIEVNSSPAVAEALLEPLVEDLVAVQVNRYFVGANKNEKETSGSSAGKGNAWELLFEGAKTHS